MTTTDIIIIILLLWGAVNGFIKGFVVQVLTLLALIFGVWIASKLQEPMGNMLSHWLSVKGWLMKGISFTLVFILTLIGIHFLGILITKMMGKSIVGRLNRIGGILFGILKMAFIISVVLYIVAKFDTKQKWLTSSYKQKSVAYKSVAWIAPTVFPHLTEVKDKLIKEKD